MRKGKSLLASSQIRFHGPLFFSAWQTRLSLGHVAGKWNRPYLYSRYWTGTSLQWRLVLGNNIKVDGTSFPDAGSLLTTAHLTREKNQKPKQIWRHKHYCPPGVFFPCLSEIGSKRKLSFGRQLLSYSVCVRKTLFVAQCPKFKAKVSISVAINPVGDRDQ